MNSVREAANRLGEGRISAFELVGDFYPAGDEQVMVYEVLGKVVPERGIPCKLAQLLAMWNRFATLPMLWTAYPLPTVILR